MMMMGFGRCTRGTGAEFRAVEVCAWEFHKIIASKCFKSWWDGLARFTRRSDIPASLPLNLRFPGKCHVGRMHPGRWRSSFRAHDRRRPWYSRPEGADDNLGLLFGNPAGGCGTACIARRHVIRSFEINERRRRRIRLALPSCNVSPLCAVLNVQCSETKRAVRVRLSWHHSVSRSKNLQLLGL